MKIRLAHRLCTDFQYFVQHNSGIKRLFQGRNFRVDLKFEKSATFMLNEGGGNNPLNNIKETAFLVRDGFP